jgi:hypothetical protein
VITGAVDRRRSGRGRHARVQHPLALGDRLDETLRLYLRVVRQDDGLKVIPRVPPAHRPGPIKTPPASNNTPLIRSHTASTLRRVADARVVPETGRFCCSMYWRTSLSGAPAKYKPDQSMMAW